MDEFDLYYWPVPFRGQFIRAVLAHAGKRWSENDPDAIEKLMQAPQHDRPLPFMGPPLLVDRRSDFALAQMPAIVAYLGGIFGLMPDSPQGQALTIKITNDANDVIDELTLFGGRQMWTPEKWADFVPRLERWMAIWAQTGRRHGLGQDDGFLLGTASAGVADIVTATLWSTMTDRFPVIDQLLDATAPNIANLCRRMQATPALAALARDAFARYGNAYCGGEIEKSLRAVAV